MKERPKQVDFTILESQFNSERANQSSRRILRIFQGLNSITANLTRTRGRKIATILATAGLAALPLALPLVGLPVVATWVVAETGAVIAAPLMGGIVRDPEARAERAIRRIRRKTRDKDALPISQKTLAPIFADSRQLISQEQFDLWEGRRARKEEVQSREEQSFRIVYENFEKQGSIQDPDQIVNQVQTIIWQAQILSLKRQGNLFLQILPNALGFIFTVGIGTYLNKAVELGSGGLAAVADDLVLPVIVGVSEIVIAGIDLVTYFQKKLFKTAKKAIGSILKH